jgi:NTE family protein
VIDSLEGRLTMSKGVRGSGIVQAGRKIGLALGGGGARGWAHVGVCRALTEAGIRPDFVAGTSIGALVGAVFAAGKLDAIEEAAYHPDPERILDVIQILFPDHLRSGRFSRNLGKIVKRMQILFPHAKILERSAHNRFCDKYLGCDNIEDLPVPFAAVATNMETGEEVVLREGCTLEAVRASISIPGVLAPVVRVGMVLVDGGLVNPVPVDVVRHMGADFVIAVDLQYDVTERRKKRYERLKAEASVVRKGRLPRPKAAEILTATIDIMERTITELRMRLEKPDLLIQPEVGDVNLLEFHKAQATVREGYRQAREKIRSVK